MFLFHDVAYYIIDKIILPWWLARSIVAKFIVVDIIILTGHYSNVPSLVKTMAKLSPRGLLKIPLSPYVKEISRSEINLKIDYARSLNSFSTSGFPS